MIKRMKKFMLWAALLAGLTLLAGCFDYTLDFRLDQDGSGSLNTALSLPAHLAGQAQGRVLSTIILPLPQRQVQEQGTRLVISESAKFQWMDFLSTRRVRFVIKEIDHGPLGLTDSTYRITAQLASAEGDMPDRDVRPGTEHDLRPGAGGDDSPAALQARRYLARSWGNHFLTMHLELPGKIIDAFPIQVGDKDIMPRIGPQNRQVTWKVPLSLLATVNVRHTLVFEADFKTKLTFRGPLQRQVTSHFATLEDHKKAQEKRLKLGEGDQPPQKERP